VPKTKQGHFLKKINAYAEEETSGDNPRPKNQPLIDSIGDIREALLGSFWRQEELQFIPESTPSWVEVWLSSDDDETIDQFNEVSAELGIARAEGFLRFPERAVEMIYADRPQLDLLIKASDDIAEMRAVKAVATIFIEIENQEQLEHVRSLLQRVIVDQSTNTAVCILDTGVNNGHLLLQPVLADADMHTVHPNWGTADYKGHGTQMAGVVAYGDLVDALQAGMPIHLTHRLESAKILPPSGQTDPKLWGYMTAQGISLAEIQAPDRARVICLAVGATDTRDRGRPSSWSAKLDDLASGASDNTKRLILVAAGNVEDATDWIAYPDSNLTSEVHDPGQAWNALTIGAYTEKVGISHPTLQGWTPIAPPRGLSPYSTTSSDWEPKWPIKPEVVIEGGNVARGPNNSTLESEDLALLSTNHDLAVAQFAPFRATSAATALAARMAARIQHEYPEAWPETVRALIVHSADWTDTMLLQFLPDQSKSGYKHLLRACGYGVPSLHRALRCTQNSLTLISQAELQPYDKAGGRYVTRDMHLYDLPWPTDILLDLGEIPVSMRVTLSYFVEPGPGEVGWQDRYRYSSFGLRFNVNSPQESKADFLRRVNVLARENGEAPGTASPTDKWILGYDSRSVGSIHSDIWKGTAAELASSHHIAVYPTIGWWRERHYLGKWGKRCTYSLIVSIDTPVENVDIYTPVALQIGIATPIEISTPLLED